MAPVNDVAPEQLDPYLYFNCEVTAYGLMGARLRGQIPGARLSFSITAEQEAELLRSHMRSYQPDRYRRKVGRGGKDLPLKALLVEYVEGARLTREALLSNKSMQKELLEAMSQVHGCGVIWGDVKWRNIIVRDHSSRSDSTELPSIQESSVLASPPRKTLVILDFSNARFLQPNEQEESQRCIEVGMLGAEEWEQKRQQELRIVRNMINHGRLTEPRGG
ncbi:hypothetical protein MMC16_006133 [Acarospora aff. strigata]|nr:hypothetical protein [Acarospora aff. strigata]